MELKLDENVMYKIKTSPFGYQLQHYEIFGLLGWGGFSEVYRAKCVRTGTSVAIKKIRKQIIRKEGLFERISEEINVQSRLNHPNVLKLFTVFEDDEYVCMVLELCTKGALLKPAATNKDSRQSATFTENETRVFFEQILDGLSYLHSNNVIHRDIKPANILLTNDDKIKIADFGLATRYAGEPHTTMAGTPNYMSHKVLNGEKYGPEVDLWSLGCLLYCLLVGKPPFDSNNIKNTLNRVVSGNYEIPSNLSWEARDLIDRLLQKNIQKQIRLTEIYNHPFICPTKLISHDSGFDTFGSSSNNNRASSHFHSLDRKRDPHETPRSSKRSRSYDRRSPDKLVQIDKHVDYLIQQPKLFAINSDCPSRRYEYSTPEINRFTEKVSSNCDFSPLRHTPTKPDCELFYENELLERKHTVYPDYEFPSPVVKSVGSDCMKYSSLNHQLDKDICPCKLNLLKRADVRKNRDGDPIVDGLSSESESVDDRIKVRPLSTERLKATRHRLKNIVLSILKNGEVCLEWLRCSRSKNKEIVVEVVRISKNGSKMFIYYPNEGRGIPVSDHPPVLPLQGADAVFNCETLSKENYKKYSYAAKFVEMVRSKTPKLTLYTDRAKCVLMENKPSPDFEIIYYDGAKITKSRKGIKLTDNNGVISVLDDTGQDTVRDALFAIHYNYYKQCYKHCRYVEDQLSSSSISNSGVIFKIFPAILGKKPTSPPDENETDWNYMGSPNLFHSTKYPA